jgi:RNA polymerase primary sigma factor
MRAKRKKTPEYFKKLIAKTIYMNRYVQDMRVITSCYDSYPVVEPDMRELDSFIEGGVTLKLDYDRDYCNKIMGTPRLTADKELEYGFRLKTKQIAEKRLEAEHLTDSQKSMLTSMVEGGKNAREQMILSNMALVLWIANRFRHNGLDDMDLVQEGTLGLIQAVDRFDVEKGVRFSTYATWWVTHAITRALAKHARLIRLPENIIRQIVRMKTIENTHVQEFHVPPTDDMLAFEMKTTPEHIAHLRDLARTPVSLHMEIDEERTLEESIPSTHATPDEHDRVYTKHVFLEELLMTLSTLERQVIELRYGLIDGKKNSFNEIARKLGKHEQYVFRVEKRARDKLRPSMIEAKGAFI